MLISSAQPFAFAIGVEFALCVRISGLCQMSLSFPNVCRSLRICSYYVVMVSGAGTIMHEGARAPTLGNGLARRHRRGHLLKRVAHQGNTSWSNLAFDQVAASGSYISHGWTSTERRLKTYSRTTVGQPRLSSLPILHCHQDWADKLNLKAISQEFVCVCDQRSIFGSYYRISLTCIHNFVATSLNPTDWLFCLVMIGSRYFVYLCNSVKLTIIISINALCCVTKIIQLQSYVIDLCSWMRLWTLTIWNRPFLL